MSPEWVQPISTDYRGWKVSELPPNGQGIGTLEMLNIIENFPIGQYNQSSVQALHLEIEAEKLAFSDLERYVGDPEVCRGARCGPVVEALRQTTRRIDRSGEGALRRGGGYSTAGAAHSSNGHGNTTYLSVVDKEGNTVSWIQSNSEIFGSGILVQGMGFLLHDRGAAFEFRPESSQCARAA